MAAGKREAGIREKRGGGRLIKSYICTLKTRQDSQYLIAELYPLLARRVFCFCDPDCDPATGCDPLEVCNLLIFK